MLPNPTMTKSKNISDLKPCLPILPPPSAEMDLGHSRTGLAFHATSWGEAAPVGPGELSGIPFTLGW